MSTDARINNTPGFVLHTYPFKETSVVAEAFTREHGRVALIARGARRPGSALRGLVQPFRPLLLSWFGRAEMKTLHAAEWQGGLPLPQGRSLLVGFYLNELILRLLARGDAHEALYDTYVATLAALAEPAADHARILRRFEKALLAETGYGARFDRVAETGEAVEPGRSYVYVPEHGVLHDLGQGGCRVRGQTLIDLAADRMDDPLTQTEAKILMRGLVDHILGGKPLYTRQLLRELSDLAP